MTDARVTRGLHKQLESWRERLAGGERRLGWKIGLNPPPVQEQLGLDRAVIGHMTDGTLLESGGVYVLAGGRNVGVEMEIAVHIGRTVHAGADLQTAHDAIAAIAPALEIVDIDLGFDDLERIVAENIFHRGVIVGEPDLSRGNRRLEGVTARILKNGEEQHAVDVAAPFDELPGVVQLVADLLGEHGEALRADDVIIAGALAPIVFVSTGDTVRAEFSALGTLAIDFSD